MPDPVVTAPALAAEPDLVVARTVAHPERASHAGGRPVSASREEAAALSAGPSGARRRSPAGLAPLASPGYRFLFIGTTLTMAGYFAQVVAQGWLIYDLTGSPTWLGIVSFANGIPMLILALPAGVLVDRLDRRKVLILGQTLTALVTFLLAGLIASKLVEAWHVAVLSFLAGCFFVLIIPARQALLHMTVERHALGSAIALNSAGTNFGRVIGPSVAGVTIAAFGAATAFTVQGLGFVGALACAILMPVRASAAHTRPRSPLQSLLEGLTYVWRDPTVFALMLLQAIPAFLIMPYNQLLPIFARDILNAGPEGLGTLMTVMGVGSVLGSVVIVLLPTRRQSLFLFASLIGLGLLLALFAASTSLPLSIGIMALIGVAQSIYLATNNTLVQLAVPDALQGRVMSVYMTTWGLMPLGALPQGILADWFGAPVVLGGVGLLSAVIVAVMAIQNPALRRL
ncbi:MAG: MFS transporter [Chloroflexota bacterium]